MSGNGWMCASDEVIITEKIRKAAVSWEMGNHRLDREQGVEPGNQPITVVSFITWELCRSQVKPPPQRNPKPDQFSIRTPKQSHHPFVHRLQSRA